MAEQCADCELKYYFTNKPDLTKNIMLNKRFYLKVIGDVEIHTYDENCLVIVTKLQSNSVTR